ncbi:CopG family transcriptional regulator [Streptosporangium sp. 'caverna']|uniref:CopG family transcriptional regulator n=1 Tax=Streptosporangium sp. 'caverna' TaxID=2202249 RepID=UPI000D7E06F0|nr:CopG family transcriptional regulator [Streptosporangium sp. 'caverna']AWS40957.1 CopG family transcriptional regulator [Streptosporangium sp. 'caverna']
MSGGTKKFSVTIPEELAETVQARIGKGSFSAYVSEALARQVERDNLRELVVAAESQHGQVDRAAVETKRALLREESPTQSADRTSAA